MYNLGRPHLRYGTWLERSEVPRNCIDTTILISAPTKKLFHVSHQRYLGYIFLIIITFRFWWPHLVVCRLVHYVLEFQRFLLLTSWASATRNDVIYNSRPSFCSWCLKECWSRMFSRTIFPGHHTRLEIFRPFLPGGGRGNCNSTHISPHAQQNQSFLWLVGRPHSSLQWHTILFSFFYMTAYRHLRLML
jgi:hypothetical protein